MSNSVSLSQYKIFEDRRMNLDSNNIYSNKFKYYKLTIEDLKK